MTKEFKQASTGTGIRTKAIQLSACSITTNDDSAEELYYELGITDLSQKYNDDKSILELIVTFDLMKGVPNPAFNLVATYKAEYERREDAKLTWEQFPPHVALAHVVPFLRELISSLTSKTEYPTLLLSPFNTKALLDEFLQKKAEAAE